jgi:CheY-like chemotaxis protein
VLFRSSRYLVGLSHELRTPLNAVLGYAQVLERDAAMPPTRANAVRVIRRSAEHLSGLIDGLLDISRIEAGRLELARNEIRLPDFLDQLVDMFRLQAEAKGLAFRFTRPTRLPEVVVADEKRLRQVLVNLISNAIKFTDRGSVHLDLNMRHEIATFTVTDTGRGIAEDDLARIFEPFERGREAKTAPGLGLGLTISKMLVTLMGGDIRVDSRIGEGSRFRVRMHLGVRVAAAAPSPLPRRGYAGPRRTIMVVDDNRDHRELVRAALEPLGFVVAEAEDGPTALTEGARIRPDLFLLDISMPGMDGWEVARRLRESGHGAARIVVLSANIGDTSPPPAEEEAHDAVLAKPFELRRLFDILQVQLGLEWLDDDEAPPSPAGPAPAKAPPPEPAEIAEMLQLARIGYARGLEQKLVAVEARLGADGGPLHPCLAEVRRALADFDMGRVVSELESFDADA